MPRLTRTIPTIRRTSQRLTWRPGVNQRTTRGFIRKGATGAPSVAQHFLNSFPARFVTSIGPYAGPRKRAYNRRKVRENVIRTQFTQPVQRQKEVVPGWRSRQRASRARLRPEKRSRRSTGFFL